MHLPTLHGCRKLAARHLRFIGPGLVAAVAYIDPGNWATDLQAGASYGYKLLFIVLIAGLAAIVLQTLAVRLGATTATSLPHQTRQLFLRLEARYPKYRVPLHCLLWCLYILAEVAIIATDLAELLGSAIALNLLFPKLPLWGGVLITAVDVLIVLAFFNSSKGRRGMLLFEILIMSLVLAVFVSFMVLLKLVRPNWGDVFLGFVPSKTLVEPGALYVGVGIIGATVMPHALFLGSSLASVDRLDMQPRLPEPPTYLHRKLGQKLPSLFRRRTPSAGDDGEYELDAMDRVRPSSVGDDNQGNIERGRAAKDMEGLGSSDTLDVEMKRYEAAMKSFDRIKWVDIHLRHATIDTTFSLLCFALTINSAILILAGAAFYYNPDSTGEADIPGAFQLMQSYIGSGAGIVFAVALLCSGQSASITATLAGQVVSEGFINWRTPPATRRIVTRLIGVIPAAAVAASAGQKGLNTMLVASQVLLSVILPTVIFPLVFLCSKDSVMTVEGVDLSEQPLTMPGASTDRTPADGEIVPADSGVNSSTTPEQRKKTKSYRSPVWITVIGYVLFTVIVVANAYVIVQLARGQT